MRERNYTYKAKIISCNNIKQLWPWCNPWYENHVGEIVRVFKLGKEHGSGQAKRIRYCKHIDNEGRLQTGKIHIKDLDFNV